MTFNSLYAVFGCRLDFAHEVYIFAIRLIPIQCILGAFSRHFCVRGIGLMRACSLTGYYAMQTINTKVEAYVWRWLVFVVDGLPLPLFARQHCPFLKRMQAALEGNSLPEHCPSHH